MFTIALFTIAKTWKQLKCPSKDEWIKNEIITFGATWMDLEIIILNEGEYDVTYMWTLKYRTNELMYKTERGPQT